MSERAPSVPTTPESTTPSPAETNPDTVDPAPEFSEADIKKDAASLVDKLNPAQDTPENPLSMNPEEQQTKARFENITKLRIGIRDAITPAINNLESSTDYARSKGDMLAKKAFLLEYREGARQRKVTRLQSELARATVGTRRHRKLLYKYGKTNRKLGEIQRNISRLDSGAENRAAEHSNNDMLRAKEVQLRNDMLKVEKKVAYEKKERRKMKNELQSTADESRKEELRATIAAWPNIGAFRQKLLNEALKRYSSQPDGKKDDYALAL